MEDYLCVAARKGKRPYMEDRYVCNSDGGNTRFYAVFDGHGGQEVCCASCSTVIVFIHSCCRRRCLRKSECGMPCASTSSSTQRTPVRCRRQSRRCDFDCGVIALVHSSPDIPSYTRGHARQAPVVAIQVRMAVILFSELF